MFPITQQQLEDTIKRLGIIEISSATIRQICSLADELEKVASEKFVHLEIGNPGLPASQIGINAEKHALDSGVAGSYPNIAGIPKLKENASRFIKAFIDTDIPAKCIVPTVGSMQASFTMMLLLKQRLAEKDTMLFINPGFPAQRNQAKLLGMETASFDIYEYRGAKRLEAKLESILSTGRITGIIYSNPNNPAWTNLTEEELEVIGRLATKYDAIVLEDLAYLAMDFRKDFGKPFVPPFVPTVAKYTDNYILMISASKIFSYAGQRIAIVAMSEKVYNRHYCFFEEFYEMPAFGDAYTYGVLYCSSSGTAHSAQYALAAMMHEATEGRLDFVKTCSEYGKRAEKVKQILKENGFHLVYALDGETSIADGFFFTTGYKNLTATQLQLELLRYGISSISLPSTGSEQQGVRICVSMVSDNETFSQLEKRLKQFNNDH
jgi:aspartate/methionine/tyrosine aminotransferase